MEERKLTDKEERIAQSLPDKEFKKRYGKDWKSVKIATATKMAKMKESVIRKYIKEQIKSLHEERRVVKIYQSWKKGEKANLNDLGEGNYGFDPRAIAQYFKPLNSRVGIAKEDVSVFGMSNGSVELHASSDKDKFHEQEDEPSDAEYDQMAKDAEQDDLMRKAAELGYLDLEENELDELNSYEMGKLPDFELLRKNVSQMLGVEVDDDVRSGMYNGREGYYSRISRRDLTDWSKEQIEKLKQAFKKTNFESNDYEFEYNSVSDFEVEPGERDYPASFDYFATEKKYGDDDRDNFPDLEESDKDDYGRSVSGKDKRTFVDPKDLTPAARAKKLAGMKEEKSKEDQLKIARAAFKKAEMDGDIRGQELALAAIDLIKGKRIKGLGKSSRLKEIASELGYLNEITVSGGQEAARNYPPTENPGDMFAQKEVEELLPSSFESRNQELKARIQAHAEWAKQDRFNNTFVHFQSNTVTDGNNTYRIAMSQHYNGNYTGFKNPRFTEIRVKELDNESDMEKDLGKYVVDTTALMQDLRKLKTIERVS